MKITPRISWFVFAIIVVGLVAILFFWQSNKPGTASLKPLCPKMVNDHSCVITGTGSDVNKAEAERLALKDCEVKMKTCKIAEERENTINKNKCESNLVPRCRFDSALTKTPACGDTTPCRPPDPRTGKIKCTTVGKYKYDNYKCDPVITPPPPPVPR